MASPDGGNRRARTSRRAARKATRRGASAAPKEGRRKQPGKTAAVFLDRDGTLIEEVGYVNHPDRARLFPWAARAVRKLNRAGLTVVVVTNQSGVARGYFSEALVRRVHRDIAREFRKAGARVAAFYYCPHHPASRIRKYRRDCRCRKPETGMIEAAAKKFGINVSDSYVVGDSYRDMQTGFNAGARTVMVLTGYGLGEYTYLRRTWPRRPDNVVRDLRDAVEIILKNRRAGRRRPAALPSK